MRNSLAVAALIGLIGVLLALMAQALWIAPIRGADALPAAVVFSGPVVMWWLQRRCHGRS